MIEITKACTVAFMKAKNYFVAWCREKHANWKKKQKMVRMYIFKALPDRFLWASKLISSVKDNKIFKDDLLSNGLQEKVMICYLKQIRCSLLRKSSWQWLLANRWKMKDLDKLLMVLTFHFSFVCYLGRICK